MLCVHIEDIGTFDLHGLILCESEGVLFELLCIHNVGMGTFALHGLILCVSEGVLSELLRVHIVGMEILTFMDGFYVFLQILFSSKGLATECAWRLLVHFFGEISHQAIALQSIVGAKGQSYILQMIPKLNFTHLQVLVTSEVSHAEVRIRHQTLRLTLVVNLNFRLDCFNSITLKIKTL